MEFQNELNEIKKIIVEAFPYVSVNTFYDDNDGFYEVIITNLNDCDFETYQQIFENLQFNFGVMKDIPLIISLENIRRAYSWAKKKQGAYSTNQGIKTTILKSDNSSANSFLKSPENKYFQNALNIESAEDKLLARAA